MAKTKIVGKSDLDLSDFELNGPMHVEWEAWQAVCEEMRAKAIEPNDRANNNLFRLIRIWGERLAQLRRGQPVEYTAQAIAQDQANLRVSNG